MLVTAGWSCLVPRGRASVAKRRRDEHRSTGAPPAIPAFSNRHVQHACLLSRAVCTHSGDQGHECASMHGRPGPGRVSGRHLVTVVPCDTHVTLVRWGASRGERLARTTQRADRPGSWKPPAAPRLPACCLRLAAPGASSIAAGHLPAGRSRSKRPAGRDEALDPSTPTRRCTACSAAARPAARHTPRATRHNLQRRDRTSTDGRRPTALSACPSTAAGRWPTHESASQCRHHLAFFFSAHTGSLALSAHYAGARPWPHCRHNGALSVQRPAGAIIITHRAAIIVHRPSILDHRP